MNNIFENAYFGKPYKTKDRKKVLYVGSTSDGLYFCISEETLIIHNYLSNGQETIFEHQGIEDSPFNIVSEWQEPINEEKLKIAINKIKISSTSALENVKYRNLNKLEIEIYTKGYKQGWEDKSCG